MAENFDGRGQSDVSLLEVLQTVKQSTMRDISVASFGIVKETGDYCKVQTFPTLTGEADTTTKALNCYGALNTGDVVLVIYTDRNFIQNIAQITGGKKMTTLDNDKELHSKRFGVIVAKLSLGGN